QPKPEMPKMGINIVCKKPNRFLKPVRFKTTTALRHFDTPSALSERSAATRNTQPATSRNFGTTRTSHQTTPNNSQEPKANG
ncbi:MAG: hypothetical protein PHP31_05115, partial [Lentimicrobiaceae bacterium]|nr:hypothetical protein [Lentimicrobiaceae bacterium]